MATNERRAAQQRAAADKRRSYARFARFINAPLAADPGVRRTRELVERGGMKGRRRALSQEYLDPGHTPLRGGVKRQVVGITLVTVPLIFGGKVIDVLGDDVLVLRWVAGILACAGAVGGALYHPVRRFWWRGAIAGVVAIAGAFGMYRLYQRLRPEPFGPEFAVVAFLGALPGVFVYYVLMRKQYVSEAELSA